MASVCEEKSNTRITSAGVFSKSYQLLFNLLGIRFTSRKRVTFCLLHVFFLLKMLRIDIVDTLERIEERKGFLATAFNASFDLLPALEFSYLFFKLSQLNEYIDKFFERNNEMNCHCASFIHSSRRRTLLSSLFICAMYIICVSISFTAVPIDKMSQEPMIRRHLPFGIRFGESFDWIAVLISSVHHQITLVYIPLSSSLYLTYFFMLIHLKKTIVKMIDPSRVDTLLQQLDELEELQITLESTLSIVPLIWLAYGIGPGLVSMLIIAQTNELGSTTATALFTAHHSVNIVLIVTSLFIISKEQEEVVKSIRFLNKFHWRRFNCTVVTRIREVIKERVTVWNIFSIDRSLILGYIGSAITFSTLILQINR